MTPPYSFSFCKNTDSYRLVRWCLPCQSTAAIRKAQICKKNEINKQKLKKTKKINFMITKEKEEYALSERKPTLHEQVSQM